MTVCPDAALAGAVSLAAFHDLATRVIELREEFEIALCLLGAANPASIRRAHVMDPA